MNQDHTIEISRITWIGLVINLLLSVFKIVAGIAGSSQAVLADGFHSISDMATDLAILIGVRFWSRPPDEKHPHGHEKIESLIAFLIGVFLAFVAFGIAFNAICSMRTPDTSTPGFIALIAALVSISIKEFVYRWQVAIGRRIRSLAVIANAWHHRSDSISSIPVAVAVICARLFPGLYFLDHIGAIVVSGFILYAALKIMLPASGDLLDSAACPQHYARITEIGTETEGVREIQKIRTRKRGAGFQVDLHILVDKNLTVMQGYAIASKVKNNLIEDYSLDIVDVTTHVEPYKDF